MNPWRARAGLLLIALGFIGSGLLFIPRMGIEVDEALVSTGIYADTPAWYEWHAGGARIPVMLNPYLGALKTWMYKIIFFFTPPRPMSLRLPTLLFAALTLWLFFALLDRTVSRRAAWIGTLLLASDPVYLLMNTIDYGPVTFQFVLKLAALLLLVRFDRTGRRTDLAVAFFLFGVAMWDKAIFAWVLIGLTAGVLVVFPGSLRRHLSVGNLAVAGSATLVGALPLLIYNLSRPAETWKTSVHLEPLGVWSKYILLEKAFNGSALTGYMIEWSPGPHPGTPGHWYQSLSVALSRALHYPQQTWTIWAIAAALLSLVVLWRTPARKPILFGSVVCFATWVPMVLTAGAGGAAQHVLLLWPFHLLVIAAALERLPFRPAVITITALLCASNLAVTDRYYGDLVVNGPSPRWTDAMDPLERVLLDLHAKPIYMADWGIYETMQLLSEGNLLIRKFDASNADYARSMLDNPAGVFVTHAEGQAILPQERAALEEFARREHYAEEKITTVQDRNGRPAFDVFRFRKLPL